MHVLELKVPPLAVGLVQSVLMWFVTWVVPSFGFMVPARTFFSMAMAIAGTVIIGVGIVSFSQAKTTVNPMRPESSTSLVTSGIYRFTRNPMYLGFLLILIGWAIFLSNALAFLSLPLFVLYMNRFQIKPEEKALRGLFGKEFGVHASNVRRWL